MAIAFVQALASATKTILPVGNITAGNLVIVAFVDSSGAVSGISDTGGNVWNVARTGSPGSGGLGIIPWVWYAVAKATSSPVITVVDSGTNFAIALAEYSGTTQLGATSALFQIISGSTTVTCGPINVQGSLYVYGGFNAGPYTSTSGGVQRSTVTQRVTIGDNLAATGSYTEAGTLFSAPSGFSAPFLDFSFGSQSPAGTAKAPTRILLSSGMDGLSAI